MIDSISRHSRVEVLGPTPNGRTEYLMRGERISVANCDRDEFEATANQVLASRDKYNKFKANHPFSVTMIALMNLGIIGAASFGGWKGADALLKKYKPEFLKKSVGTIFKTGGMLLGFIIGGQIVQYTDVPGKKSEKDALRRLNTFDAYDVK